MGCGGPRRRADTAVITAAVAGRPLPGRVPKESSGRARRRPHDRGPRKTQEQLRGMAVYRAEHARARTQREAVRRGGAGRRVGREVPRGRRGDVERACERAARRRGRRLTPGRALDVGCGEGADAIWLARSGWTVTAIDISDVAVAGRGRLPSWPAPRSSGSAGTPCRHRSRPVRSISCRCSTRRCPRPPARRP